MEVVEEVEPEVVHEDNDWGISLVSEDAGEVDATASTSLVKGISLAYNLPRPVSPLQDGDGQPEEADETSLEELMKQMKSM